MRSANFLLFLSFQIAAAALTPSEGNVIVFFILLTNRAYIPLQTPLYQLYL